MAVASPDTKALRSYVGRLASARISPDHGSSATIAPLLFPRAFSAASCSFGSSESTTSRPGTGAVSASVSVGRPFKAGLLLPDQIPRLDTSRRLRLRFVLTRLREISEGLRSQRARVTPHASRLHLHALDKRKPRAQRVQLRRRNGLDRHEEI